MAKDKLKLPEVLKGPISPLGIRRDYDGDQNEVKADMLKQIDLNNPPPVLLVYVILRSILAVR